MSTATLHNEKKKTLIPQLRFQEFDGEWETNKLSDWKLKVIDGDRGTNYPNGDDFSAEGYCLFMNAKNVTKNGFSFETKMFITKEKDERLRKGKLKRNDLILTTRGSVGNIAFYDDSIKFENLRINSGMVLIRNENSKIDSRFIYSSFFTPKLNRIIDTISFGSAQPQLTVKEINLFKFNIPTLPEQQKIASFLSAVDEKIQQLSRKKELLSQYKKGIMQQLFSGKLRFKDENGKDYADWEEKRLDSMISKFVVPMRDKPKELKGEIPWCRIEDFDGKYLSKSKSGQGVSFETVKEMNLKVYPIGTLLVSCSANLGFCAITETELITNQTFIGLVPNCKKVDVLYLLYVMRMLSQKLNTLSSGTTISYLSRQQFEQFKVPYPSLSEQQKIANFLSSIDAKIENTSQQIKQTQSFKKGLLQQMFV